MKVGDAAAAAAAAADDDEDDFFVAVKESKQACLSLGFLRVWQMTAS